MVVAFVACFPVATSAQMARDFLNAPVDTFGGYVDFVFTRGQSAPSSDLPLPNDLVLTRLASPNILYHFPLRKRYAGVSTALPYSRVRAVDGEIDTVGISDPTFSYHMNIFGLPAFTRDEMATAIPQTFLTAHLIVSAPLGSYDRNAPVNVGSNRWSFTPLVNLDITLDKGVSWIDVYAQGRFFTNNTEFQVDKTLSQDLLLVLTAHYSHNIGKRFWASIGVHYDHGGETSIDNVPQNNTANGIRPAASFSTKFRNGRMTFTYENTASKPDDAPRNALVKIRFSSPLF
jgi:hypothetical protein